MTPHEPAAHNSRYTPPRGQTVVNPLKKILANFSPWHPWNDRTALAMDLPGVYMLARFLRRPSLDRPALSQKVLYIGETCKTLKHRLYNFNRSAFEDKFGHSGGNTFSKLAKAQRDPTHLYISVMPVDLPSVQSEAFIRYSECALLWAYVQKYGAMPLCNRK